MFGRKKIAVVMPAYNEALMIGKAVTQIPRYVDYIIVVDDASTDGTADALSQVGCHSELFYIRHVENRGVGSAIVTGYKKSLDIGVDLIAVMAGDAQMDPRDLPELLGPLADGKADYVKGNRLAWPGVVKEMPLFRFIGNHVLSLLTRITSGYRNVQDSQCGYTVVRSETLKQIELDALYNRYGFPNDMLAKLHTVGARMLDVVVRPIYGQEVSGISIATALFRVPLVLLRSFFWRIKHERKLAGQIKVTSLNSIDG